VALSTRVRGREILGSPHSPGPQTLACWLRAGADKLGLHPTRSLGMGSRRCPRRSWRGVDGRSPTLSSCAGAARLRGTDVA
jgi:hypothetical protein